MVLYIIKDNEMRGRYGIDLGMFICGYSEGYDIKLLLDKSINKKWKTRYNTIKDTMEKLNKPYKIEVLQLQPEKYYKVV